MARPRKFQESEALDRAMDVFWTLGYDGASMSELTKAMDMNAPSIYFAFGSKRGLFDAVMERYDLRRAEYKAWVMAATTAKETTERMLFGAVQWLTDEHEPRGCLMAQAGLATGIASCDVTQELAKRRNRLTSTLTARFERAQGEGELDATVDAEALARYFQVVFNGLCIQATTQTSREELMECAQRAMLGWPVQG